MEAERMILGALAYLTVAVWLVVISARRSKPGSVRIRVVTTVFAILFSVSFLVDHGVVPVPALIIMVWCVIGDCTTMYGPWGGLIWGFLPMLGQWIFLLSTVLALHRLSRRWTDKSNGDR
jgi:hypothetical protein